MAVGKLHYFVICILVGSFVLYVSLKGLAVDESQSHYEDIGTTEDWYLWTGLPISPNNTLYFDPNQNINLYTYRVKMMKQKLLPFANDKSNDNWQTLIDENLPLIGWNGVFDAIYEVNEEQSQSPSRLHWLGELLQLDADEPRHAVEVSSRDILHKAPLHHVVWNYIIQRGANDTNDLFDYINRELCYFEDVPLMGNIWISCVHGVGHGLGELFTSAKIQDAIHVCSQSSDKQFQYACASGIYMSKVSDFSFKSFEPCENRYAPACFLYKTKTFTKFLKDSEDPCKDVKDPYHKGGCIWASIQFKPDSGKKIRKYCKMYEPEDENDFPRTIYHALCVDAAMYEYGQMSESFAVKYCAPFAKFPLSKETCDKRAATSVQELTLNGDEFYYNYDLLEYLYFNPI